MDKPALKHTNVTLLCCFAPIQEGARMKASDNVNRGWPGRPGMAECIPAPENPGSHPQHHRNPGMLVKACNPSPAEMEARRSEIQGHPWPYSEFKVHLGYWRPWQIIIRYSLSPGLVCRVSGSWTLIELPMGVDEVYTAQQLWSVPVMRTGERGEGRLFGRRRECLGFLWRLVEML